MVHLWRAFQGKGKAYLLAEDPSAAGKGGIVGKEIIHHFASDTSRVVSVYQKKLKAGVSSVSPPLERIKELPVALV